jgi:hypothetical protein
MTISQTTADPRLTAARECLGHARGVQIGQTPHAGLQRMAAELRRRLGQVLDVIGTGAIVSADQLEVLGSALADAAEYREKRASDGTCQACDASPAALCADHEADFDLSDSYLELAAELRIEVTR